MKNKFAVAQIKTQRTDCSVPLRYVFSLKLVNQEPMFLTRVFSRLLARAALFLWIRPLLTMVSILGTASLYAVLAASALPSLVACSTAFIAVRMRDRKATLCWRFFSPWRARLADCLVFATWFSSAIRHRTMGPRAAHSGHLRP
jgi:hypothetical protein